MRGQAVERLEKERPSCCADSPCTSSVTSFPQHHAEEVCGIVPYGLTVGCGIVIIPTHFQELLEELLARRRLGSRLG
jgi:hypothetical protein